MNDIVAAQNAGDGTNSTKDEEGKEKYCSWCRNIWDWKQEKGDCCRCV